MPSKLTSQFSSDTTDLLFRQIEGKNDNSLVHSKMDKDMDINDIFEISRTVETIQNGGYEKVNFSIFFLSFFLLFVSFSLIPYFALRYI